MEWQRSPRLAAIVVVGWMLVQLAIPTWRLAADGQDRFAWRMFSTFEARPTFVVHTPNDQRVVDLHEVTARLRGDLDLEAHLPDHLCRIVGDAVRITWHEGEHLCLTP